MTPVNILIVDDRPENIVTLEALLQRDDIKLFSTTSPNEGLKIAWSNQISIALIDVQMPEMDGFEFVEMLKSNPKTNEIMVIFVTAISKETKYAVKGLGTGAVDYLYKPLDPSVTIAKVDSFIRLARYQAEIKQKNEELENYSVVIENSADIICAVSADDLKIRSINPAVEIIMGYQPASLIGKSIVILAADDQKAAFEDKLSAVTNGNNGNTVYECKFKATDRSDFWAQCRIAFQNKTLFFNISDISVQKNYQKQLIKSKENAEHGKRVKETFLANMSHELRTPVNGIIGITGLLRKTNLDEQQSGMIDLLDLSSQSLLGVINDVLDISKIEAGKFTIIKIPTNLHELLRAVYGLLKFKADENNVDFILDIAADVPQYLMIDSLRMNQVLMNLLSNAIKFTGGGYVKLSVSVAQKLGSEVQLKFVVEDSGIGISAQKLETIFDAFEQADDDTARQYGGTGLGLAIVKKLVGLKGGTIAVESEPGKGSTFTFVNWYNEAQETISVKNQDNAREYASFKNINVLVAEDNFVNQFMIAKILKDWEMNVEIVDNGAKVIEKLNTNSYDLILMDTYMPGMNGYETAKLIRSNFSEPVKNIPIISLSAASLLQDQQKAIEAGMDDVLSKPFKPADLHEKIGKLLKGSGIKSLA